MQASQKALLNYLSEALFPDSQSPLLTINGRGGSNGESAGENRQALDAQVKNEALAQSVYSLIGTEADVFGIISKNVRISYEQKRLHQVLGSIPYLVLKGLAAAIYYPDPLRRALGDIDILVRPEDYAGACHTLLSAGYKTRDSIEGDSRHTRFRMNGITIELHRRYAMLNSSREEALLDGWIFDAEPVEGKIEDLTFPMLPPLLNGLALLTHINQHLEDGLGIRHILDWVMYVHRCLPDERWPEFKTYSDQLGLTLLADVAARIGQRYLHAYPEYQWCRGGEDGDHKDRLADSLLEYCFDCGNFGAKLGQDNAFTMVLSHGKGVDGFFRNLQKRGEENWQVLKAHPELRAFAWLYQSGRYVKKGLESGFSLGRLRKDVDGSKKRNRLMEQLGVKQQAVRDKDGSSSWF